MAKAVVLKVVEEYFGDILDIQDVRENLKLALWKGQVKLHNLKLNQQVCVLLSIAPSLD
jgi:hypothetical protein